MFNPQGSPKKKRRTRRRKRKNPQHRPNSPDHLPTRLPPGMRPKSKLQSGNDERQAIKTRSGGNDPGSENEQLIGNEHDAVTDLRPGNDNEDGQKGAPEKGSLVSTRDKTIADCASRGDQSALSTDKPTTQTGAEAMADTGEAEVIITEQSAFHEKSPPLQCNACFLTEVCPHFKPNYECAYLSITKACISTPQDLMNMMQELLTTDLERVRMATIAERLSGGALDDKLSARLDSAFQKLMVMTDQASKRKRASSTESVMNRLLEAAFDDD